MEPDVPPCVCVSSCGATTNYEQAHTTTIALSLLTTTVLRPRLAGLHFTSEAIFFFFFSSPNSSTGGAEAVLLNRLAKWLPYESMF